VNNKFKIYAIIVTILTTGFTWQKVLGSHSNDQYQSSARGGSGWTSFMGGGSFGGGSGGHK